MPFLSKMNAYTHICLLFYLLESCTESQNGWNWETSGGHLVQTLLKQVHHRLQPWAVSRQLLRISTERDFTSVHFTAATHRVFPTFQEELPVFQALLTAFCPLGTNEKRLALSSLHLCFRYLFPGYKDLLLTKVNVYFLSSWLSEAVGLGFYARYQQVQSKSLYMQSTGQLLTACSALSAQCNPITVPLFFPSGFPEHHLTLQ